MTTFDLQIYRPQLIFQYLAKQRKNVEYFKSDSNKEIKVLSRVKSS